ncbi:MAG: hypothetical protein LBE56_04530 [Tannerella sp.]|jgi:hypothetical protein|nr:hypothetical protein [Tannerella sp.]
MLKVRFQLRKVIAIAICLAGGAIMFAQDVITLRNGAEIQALVFEVGPDEVGYKRFDNPDGPNYKMKTSDISSIMYQNGTKDEFNNANATTPKAQQQSSVNQRADANNRDAYETENRSTAVQQRQTSTRPSPVQRQTSSRSATVQRQAQNNQRANSYDRDDYETSNRSSAYQQQSARPYRMSGSDLLRNMSLDNPALYRSYRTGRTLKGVGMGLTLGGLGLAIIGAATVGSDAVDSGSSTIDYSGTGGALAYGGVLCAIVGTPLWIIGGTKKRNARNTYLREISYQPSIEPAPYLKFQASGNGLGLAYVF